MCYAQALAEAYANASSILSSNSHSPHRYYDTRLCAYFELSAFEYEDI